MFNKLKKEIKCIKRYKNIRKNINSNKPRFIILNTPDHRNIGDHALALGEYRFLYDYFPNYAVDEFYGNLMDSRFLTDKRIKAMIGNDDIIIIHAGGYIGTIWMKEEVRVRRLLNIFKDKKVFIFPQTVFFDDDEYGKQQLYESQKIYSLCKNLVMFVREKYSERFFSENFKDCRSYLVPDMVLYLKSLKVNVSERNCIITCLRNDKEKTVDYYDVISEKLNKFELEVKKTDMMEDHQIYRESRESEVYSKIKELSKAKLVVTDRLHGMVLSALANTPCVVLKSQSYKVQGVYDWIKDLKYIAIVNDINEFDDALNRVLSVENPHYDDEILKKNFDEFYNILKMELNS